MTELTGQGTDTIQSSATITALAANVENLTLTGSSAINGTGNALNNVLTGNSGANTLIGGAGNDTYIVQNAVDVVTELAAGGTDSVQSSVTYSLAAEIENLLLTGTGLINGTGNTANNSITGNTAKNVINGGNGNDTLAGGLGQDTFAFNSAVTSANADIISDFSVLDDTFNLENTGTGLFAALTTTGVLPSGAFWTGAAAHAAGDRIIHDAATGRIYYDADGTGVTAQILFATVTAGLALTAADFVVI